RQLRLSTVQRILGLLALDELPDLAADGGHDVEQVRFRPPYLVAEKLHDPEDFAAEQDGNGERGVQPFLRGDGCTQKISILHDIGTERGFTAQPHSPRQSRSEEHTSELQSLAYLVCRLLL